MARNMIQINDRVAKIKDGAVLDIVIAIQNGIVEQRQQRFILCVHIYRDTGADEVICLLDMIRVSVGDEYIIRNAAAESVHQ